MISNYQAKYAVEELLFKYGAALVLTDWQGTATPTLDPGEKDAPDTLSDKATAAWLIEQLAKKNQQLLQYVEILNFNDTTELL